MLSQCWNSLLFAHWPLDPRALRPLVPSAFSLDLFDGRAWLALVVSQVTNFAARGFPALPFGSEFAELNLGTLVSVNGRAGAYFFSVDAGSGVAAFAGRTLLNLPYHAATMSIRRSTGSIEYDGERHDHTARFRAIASPAGRARVAAPGSLLFFLTERCSLFNVDASGHPYRIDVRRAPWQLRTAEGSVAVDDLARASRIAPPGGRPLLHYVERQEMNASLPQRIALHRGDSIRP